MNVEWVSQHPHVTRTLVVSVRLPEGQDLLDQITHFLGKRGYTRGVEAPPDADGLLDAHFFKPGSGLFDGWTEAEAKENVAEIEYVMRELWDVKHIPWRELTFRDLI